MSEKKNWWKRGVDAFVESVGYAFIRTSPLTGPLPSIYVLLNTSSGWKSLLIVVGVELIGYAVGDTAVKAMKRKVVPDKIILWAIVAYLATIEGLMLGFNVIPAWTSWYDKSVNLAEAIRATVSILYPFFTLAGAGLYAFQEFMSEGETKILEAAQVQVDEKKAEADARKQRKQQEWEDDRSHKLRLREIEIEKLQVVQSVTTGSLPVTTGLDVTSPDPALRELQLVMLPIYQADPSVSLNKLTVVTGKNKPLLHKALKNLEEAGIVEIVKTGRGQQVTVNGNYDQFMKGE